MPSVVSVPRRQAVPLQVGIPFEAGSGTTPYLLKTYSYRTFGFDPGAFSGEIWVPRSRLVETALVTQAFAYQALEIPPGWSLDLVEVRAVRTRLGGAVEVSEADIGAGSAYTFEAVFRLSIPGGVSPGLYSVEAILRTRNPESETSEFLVRID
ncbi:MAG: hypothetical protein JSV66_06415 [Trueperaceae bacterium]|nr:MAG: hypothetical protein JSV66_06415 [Trueperaceae bacterium]